MSSRQSIVFCQHFSSSSIQTARTPHAQFLKGIYTARLQQLADNAVRLLETFFQQYDTPALLAECDGSSTAQDASTDNDDICLVVDAPPLFAIVCCVYGLGRGRNLCRRASFAQLWRMCGADTRR